jgi:hypothetical protein
MAYSQGMTSVVSQGGVVTQRPMPLPASRGPVSSTLFEAFVGIIPTLAVEDAVRTGVAGTVDILADEDLQLALFCLYELHYGGIDGVDDHLEWNTDLIAARTVIENAYEDTLRALITIPKRPAPTAEAVSADLFDLTAEDAGPSLSRFVARKATMDQLQEFLIQRSIFTLKEADPHSWAIPRLTGRAKAALVEIQSDEYGGGRPQRMHSAMFASTMQAAGLDPAYGAYLDVVPAITLASVNMMSMFGLHRRLRGAIVGHLAAYEMTSSIPNRFYGDGFRRLGFNKQATWYFDEHVEADAVHEQIAGRDLAGGLAEADPDLIDEIFFGAAAVLAVDGRAAEHMLTSWTNKTTSLVRSHVMRPASLPNGFNTHESTASTPAGGDALGGALVEGRL